jgi:circadian clock protein KaiC
LLKSTSTDCENPEHIMVDGIIELERVVAQARVLRYLTVTKSRGLPHLQGRHSFEVTPAGIAVYPRTEAVLPPHDETTPTARRVGWGAPELDAAFGGGMAAGSATLLMGTPGSGKTALALQFLHAGAAEKEPGLFTGFQESATSLIDRAEKMGFAGKRWQRRKLLAFDCRRVHHTLLDEWARHTLSCLEEQGAKRLVVDDLGRLRTAAVFPERFMPFLEAFLLELRRRDVASLFLLAAEPNGTNFAVPESALLSTMDNVAETATNTRSVHPRYTLRVLKAREGGHDMRVRAMVRNATGFEALQWSETHPIGYSAEEKGGHEDHPHRR